jgi:serine/threonine protein kinase
VKIGNYEVIRPVGSGGMSDALLARSPSGRIVVLKKPKSYDPEIVARMRDEGRLGAKLYHESLVETLDMFDHEGLPVLALGYVEGVTVDELRKKAALLPAGVARIGCQIAEALGAIHEALGDDGRPLGAVHRDVSARNILVTPQGNAVLIDLGIARTDEARVARTETGMVLGTLRYMAPELIDGQGASRSSDFYSLGCVMIEAATGRSVFEGPPSEIAGQIVTKGALGTQNVAANLDPRLRPLLGGMLAMKAEQRFQESHQLSRALRDLEASLGGGQAALGERAQLALSAGQSPIAVDLPQPSNANVVIGAPSVGKTEPFHGGESRFGLTAAVAAGTMPSPMVPGAPSPGSRPAPPTETGLSAIETRPEPMTMGPATSLPANLVSQPLPTLVKPTPRPAAASAFAPPRVSSAPLELAVEPRRKTTSIDAPGDARDWYPKRKKDYGAVGDVAKKIVIGVVLVVGAFLAWRWYDAQQADEAAALAEKKAAEEARLLRQAMTDTATGPQCDQPGAVWVYTDKKGHDVIVDSLGKIPAQDRPRARCAVPVR